jgi:hypothetical protein
MLASELAETGPLKSRPRLELPHGPSLVLTGTLVMPLGGLAQSKVGPLLLGLLPVVKRRRLPCLSAPKTR